MEQIIIAVIIISLGFYVFHFYPFERGNVTKLVIAAIFVILTAICKRLAIMIPLFGTESLKIGFEYVPLMLAGYFLSPAYAFLVGLCSDMIGLMLVPTGFPFFGFTLGTILVSVIPSLVHEHAKTISSVNVLRIVKVLILLLGIGASVYIYHMDSLSVSQTVYPLTWQQRWIFILICLSLSVIFILLMTFIKRRFHAQEAKIFAIWILCVILTEIVVTLCLTPLWLNMMYQIPFVVSLCIRIVKECVVLPLEIFIGYSLIQFLKRIFTRWER